MTVHRLGRAGEPVGVASGLASSLVRTARAALGITAYGLASAAGCGEKLVVDIESGRVDPTLDTVGRLVSSVGFEVRAGPGEGPDNRYVGVDGREVQRLGAAHQQACDMATRFGAGRPGPLEGAQPEWDGTGQAPAHRFGAGPTRRDGGGWSAILVRDERSRAGMSQDELARACGLKAEDVALVESGAVKLTVTELQTVLAAMGAALVARLEVYDAHDDALHLKALADPQGYHQRMSDARAAFTRAASR